MPRPADPRFEPDGATIRLHLGAHKTATTYIQSELGRNADVLAANGIAYIPMREFRSWRRKLIRPGARFFGSPRLKFERRLRQWNPQRCETCIISDENVLGTCGDIVNSGTLYPKLHAKLGAIAGMLSEHKLGLLLSIRCYASFYAAAYGEALRFGSGSSIETFKARLDPLARRWRDVLAEIADLFPAAPIVVWPYEHFRQFEPEIFDALAGKKVGSKLRLSGAMLRPSLSQETVGRVEKLGKRFGWAIAARLVPIIEAQAGAAMPFDPWTNRERVELQQLYAGDLEEISRNGRYRMIAGTHEPTTPPFDAR